LLSVYHSLLFRLWELLLSKLAEKGMRLQQALVLVQYLRQVDEVGVFPQLRKLQIKTSKSAKKTTLKQQCLDLGGGGGMGLRASSLKMLFFKRIFSATKRPAAMLIVPTILVTYCAHYMCKAVNTYSLTVAFALLHPSQSPEAT
jgi:hypothetical protein